MLNNIAILFPEYGACMRERALKMSSTPASKTSAQPGKCRLFAAEPQQYGDQSSVGIQRRGRIAGPEQGASCHHSGLDLPH